MAMAIEEWVHSINVDYYRRLAEGGGFSCADRIEQTKTTLREIGDVIEVIAVESRPATLRKEVAEMMAELRRLEAMLPKEQG